MSSTFGKSNWHRRPPSTFTIEALIVTLEQAEIPCRRTGKEIEADIDGVGHHSYKIAPQKGVYFNAATGKGGTIAALLKRKRIDAAATATDATPTPRPAAGGQQPKDTTAQARRVWSAAWTCTHGADMPAGWDQGLAVAAKGAKRLTLEQERDAAIAYLRSRLGDAHLLHWMRQARVGRTLDGQPMLVLPMHSGGVLSGIQRVILDASGQKIERKMLGKHGYMPLPAPVGVQPAQLVPDAASCVLAGEGFETDASVVQAVGHPGIAAMDAGGLRRWADEQAAAAANATPERLAKAPAVIVLADRDASGTGQKAAAYAVRTLRAAGLRAFYAEPLSPEDGGPKGGPKGSDWNDYIREGLDGAIVAHLQLAIERGDALMPEPEQNEPASAAPVFDFSGYRLAETPAAVAETAEVDAVRAEMEIQFQRIVKEYVGWRKKDVSSRDPFEPELFHITTGVGKSRSVKHLIHDLIIRSKGVRVVVSVPDHEQALEYEKAGFFHLWSRQPDDSKAPQALCQSYVEMEQARDRGHVSQAEFCRRCSNGLAWAIKNAQKELDSGTCSEARAAVLQERIEAYTAELQRRGLDPQFVDPCRWQDHLREAINAQFVVIVHDSYSHSVVGDALFFADESFDLAKTVQIELSDIHEWSAKNAAILDSLKGHITITDEIKDKLEKHKKAGELFKVLAARMAFWAAEGKDGEVRADAELARAIEDLLALTKEKVNLAAWETLGFDDKGYLKEAPLRAAYALAESLRNIGGGHVAKGRLVIAASSPIVERVQLGMPTVFLDATPPKALQDIVKANNGKIHKLIARQNVRIVRHPSRFWGISALDPARVGAKRVQREIARYVALMKTCLNSAVLVHKRAHDQLPAQSDSVGYWGMHHRAHNRWTGKDLTIVGSFFPPESAWRSLYQQDRLAALASGCAPEHWPVWPEDAAVVDGAWVCEGDREVQSRLPLPADPHIRDWLLDRVTGETVQAIGRVRGANASSEITVRIFGGVPLAGLGEHGLQVAEYAADPVELGQSRAEVNEERHEAAMARLDAAAARLVAKGQVITTETMAAEVRATGTYGPAAPRQNRSYWHSRESNTKPIETQNAAPVAFSASTYRQWLERIRQVAPALYAHMATTGRGAAVVRAMREAAERYGRTALKAAVEIAESLVKQGDSALWDTLDALDAVDADAPTHTHKALRNVIAAVLAASDEASPPLSMLTLTS
ncbi:MAG: toprim domain-containing protein [Acidithiobacillus caldus]|uniref:Toprim domain-containing protein n=1 Tax=Acidithiobacillus caldus TaxID=33059 RepID=A0A1E7YMS1_9PROT|nr:toprim domain-containing protein [Acidithiobacillus caldus]OFC35396.1 hypothetical protein BAE27_07395 [Acidithiobacillus caldus]OFC37321.1 hypothetical protein BAE28_07335 [Acidithiobacillus caldus]OFC39601.1 hypothetical protein BAE29_07140 [Acidithiobacillus caldus]WMT47202.1 MAG: toprim domain-containing protein [Acidithiobacillus caldus]